MIVARRNFGTGSSREAAVYALWDFGIRCVIATVLRGYLRIERGEERAIAGADQS